MHKTSIVYHTKTVCNTLAKMYFQSQSMITKDKHCASSIQKTLNLLLRALNPTWWKTFLIITLQTSIVRRCISFPQQKIWKKRCQTLEIWGSKIQILQTIGNPHFYQLLKWMRQAKNSLIQPLIIVQKKTWKVRWAKLKKTLAKRIYLK